MKTSLDHLPEEKRDRLATLVQVIREAGPAEMIILFGSHARGDWVQDPLTGYESDYDVLVVTKLRTVAEDGTVWSKATDRFRAMPGWPMVDIIVHDFKFVNDQLAHGQYFFRDIAREGVLLHTSGAFAFPAHRAPSPEERKAQATRDFERFFVSAGQFFITYEDHLGRGWLNKGAFELHQATERYFAAFLLTFTAYMPKSHNIEDMADTASRTHPDMRPLLPRKDPEDRRLFDLLKKAYVDARYSTKYQITAEELVTLGARVKELGAVVERVCKQEIATLG